jgi:hypothetical protein
MVIDNPYIARLAIDPGKTDSPAVADPNAEGPRSILFQLFEAVPRRHSQILQSIS